MEMGDLLSNKLDALRKKISGFESALIAFSGGVDSTFLLMLAQQELGDRVLAVTMDTILIPRRELQDAEEIAKNLRVRHLIISADPLELPLVRANSSERCYHCKHNLFKVLCSLAREGGYNAVFDGTNQDDESDYRPGMRAIRELGVQSPLQDVRITKDEIRQLSRAAGLSTWNKSAAACLASRIPYGEQITPKKLKMIEEAEGYLLSLGCSTVRVRHHQGMARIETAMKDFTVILKQHTEITRYLQELGFLYVTLDLMGYRRGSLNQLL